MKRGSAWFLTTGLLIVYLLFIAGTWTNTNNDFSDKLVITGIISLVGLIFAAICTAD